MNTFIKMKKIINLIITIILTITSLVNTNAMGNYVDKEVLILNWKVLWTWKQLTNFYEIDNVIYFDWRTWNYLESWVIEVKYYQIKDWILKEINEADIPEGSSANTSKAWSALEKHIKQEANLDYVNDLYVTTLYIDWKKIWDFNTNRVRTWAISEKVFSYTTYELKDWKSYDYRNIITYFEEEKDTVKPVPSIDKELEKFYTKIDKKWGKEAKKYYQNVIYKIDLLLDKKLNSQKRELLKYLKNKIEEKIKQ